MTRIEEGKNSIENGNKRKRVGSELLFLAATGREEEEEEADGHYQHRPINVHSRQYTTGVTLTIFINTQ